MVLWYMGRLIESLPIRLLSVIREVGVVVTILLLTRLPLVEYGVFGPIYCLGMWLALIKKKLI